MSRIVFVLGAGASVHAGAPMMSNFLDKAEALLQAGNDPAHEALQRTFKGIYNLSIAQSKTNIGRDNIEDVYGAFEMASICGRLGALTTEEVDLLPAAIRTVISRTLEETIDFPVRGDTWVEPPVGYLHFAELLRSVIDPESRQKCPVSILTFNYDTCMEAALFKQNIPYDYCLAGGCATEAHMPLLKLHGSMNWFRLISGRIHVLPMSVILERQHNFLSGTQRTHLRWSEFINHAHPDRENSNVSYDSVIVPPTWSKAEHHRGISPVWRAAATELSDAEYIFFLGYSLPESDSFFRFLFALGTSGEARFKHIGVCDPATSVHERYRNLLSRSSADRFVPTNARFEESSGHIRHVLAGLIPQR